MSDHPVRIVVDTARNVLRVVVRESTPAAGPVALAATVDVGEEGRLLGIEVDIAADPRLGMPWRSGANSSVVEVDAATGTLYVSLGDGTTTQARSAAATAAALVDADGAIAEIAVLRRGEGYEITYPSGNQ